MFEAKKTTVFWVGLIILGLSSVYLFSTLWYNVVFSYGYVAYWKILTPPIVSSLVFILIGFYMMKSGVRKEKEKQSEAI